MKTPRLSILAGILLPLLATGAAAWPWSKPLTKEEVVKEALERYREVHEKLANDYPDNPEWLVQLDKAQAYFKDNSEAYLKQDLPYREEELRRLKKVVDEQIRGEQATIDVYRMAQRKGWDAHYTAQRVELVQEQTALKIQTAAMPEMPNNPAPAPVTVGDIGHTRPSAITPLSPRDPWQPGRIEAASLVVNLAVASVACGQHNDKCAPPAPLPPIPVPPEPVQPIPSPGTPAQPLPTAPNQTGGEPPVPIVMPRNWHHNAAATATGPGATNGMITGGVMAANRGDYSMALSLAKAALSSDPANKNALALLYSVKGRSDAIDVGASGLSAAKAGASALGGAPGETGSFGAASPASGIAAAALSGAAKVASDFARAGAMNALKLGDATGALGILSKALAENPNNPALLNLRAQTYGRMGHWEEALKDAVAGLALAPGNMILLNTKALAENRTRRWRDAIATADMMIAADPKNAWAYANRAHARGGLGDREAMLADINRAAALDARFQQTAAGAAQLQLPFDSDTMFLFPGESAKGLSKVPATRPGRGKSFSVVVGAGIVGGLLLALGLLSTVLRPLKDTVVSAFTRVKRTGSVSAAVATAQPASVAGNVGGLIRGQYEIARQIGAGGMGMVYEGTDRSLGRRVAIKKMRDELRLNARERDRFIIEAKTVASLHHPNIVDIYAIAEEGEDVYLVFEYVDGKTVHDLVQTAGRLALPEALRVTRAMGEALTYAHSRGVIHRDMKPSNVMLTSAGHIKVMDFGIARMAKDAMTRYSMTNTVVGTPPYMAPEQEQGVVRKESDVYALAICAYEMLTGKLPFIGLGAGMLMNKINMSYIPPSRNIAGLPESLDEVFLKAFQADPDRRYRTPQEFVTALAAAADGARTKA